MSNQRGGWGRSAPERLASNVRPGPGGCSEYHGARNNGGYGLFNVRGEDGRWRLKTAHRVAWELANGPIPDGLCVLHKCDNRRCVNVAHLFLGTHGDNMADKVAKGRAVRGESHPRAKLSAAMVKRIRSMRAMGGRVCEIARELGIAQGSVAAVLAKRSWAWVE